MFSTRSGKWRSINANNFLQGIHILLNNCPKLTHLSLTGVQAFLRDELLAFCREAPPEFNEHQRDVFCVFSGTGVARLRDFLNEQKAHAAAAESATPSLADESDPGIDIDIDDHNPESDGGHTPLINVSVNVHHHYPMGPTTIISGPNTSFHQFSNNPGHAISPSVFSQSAPASTGGPSWSATVNTGPLHHHQGSAQHVIGMMGATILDEVDAGDEAFGGGSEIMGD